MFALHVHAMQMLGSATMLLLRCGLNDVTCAVRTRSRKNKVRNNSVADRELASRAPASQLAWVKPLMCPR